MLPYPSVMTQALSKAGLMATWPARFMYPIFPSNRMGYSRGRATGAIFCPSPADGGGSSGGRAWSRMRHQPATVTPQITTAARYHLVRFGIPAPPVAELVSMLTGAGQLMTGAGQPITACRSAYHPAGQPIA